LACKHWYKSTRTQSASLAWCVLYQARPGFTLTVPGHGTLKAQGDRDGVQKWVTTIGKVLSRLRLGGDFAASPTNDGWELPPESAPGTSRFDGGELAASARWKSDSDGDSSSSEDRPDSPFELPRSPSTKKPPPMRPVSSRVAGDTVREKAKAAAERRQRATVVGPIESSTCSQSFTKCACHDVSHSAPYFSAQKKKSPWSRNRNFMNQFTSIV